MPEFLTLDAAFAYFTECNLATLDRLQTLSRSSKSERQRQKNICDSMVSTCRDYNIMPRANIRLAKALSSPTTEPPK